MLYKLNLNHGRFDRITPVAFKDFSHFNQFEIDLEKLISENYDVLFEDNRLMLVYRQTPGQGVSDVYALNEKGELFIFELKLRIAGSAAVDQVLRYAQNAGQWKYAKLQENYQCFLRNDNANLLCAHKEAFGLEVPLKENEFNNRQHLIIVGTAADDELIIAVDYWRAQGISINFLPYRIFELGEELYFEFFSPPYDKHINLNDRKGVIFDTCRSWDEDAIWYMMDNNRVAAFGDAQIFVQYIRPGDIVFFSHTGVGIVAAARVQSQVQFDCDDTAYRTVEFLTSFPERNGNEILAMPFNKVAEFTGKKFFWARTVKVPYLSMSEAESLVVELQNYL